jgi:protein-arginine kinase activator protein McsA
MGLIANKKRVVSGNYAMLSVNEKSFYVRKNNTWVHADVDESTFCNLSPACYSNAAAKTCESAEATQQRLMHKDRESVMKTEPGFKPGLQPNSAKSTVCDGKVIELMSEIECQVYLKQALESEDFETAAKIREQLNKYR